MLDPEVAGAAASAAPTWLPLESNPEILNGFAKRLGCPSAWGFVDVFGLDDELLCMIPQPCAALCLLFPSKNISKPRRAELRARVAAAPQTISPKLWFATQHDDVGNACGAAEHPREVDWISLAQTDEGSEEGGDRGAF